MKTSVVHAKHASSRPGTGIFFPEGIIGFDEHRQYTIVKEKSKEPFFWLQSSNNADVNFIIISPSEFKDDYDPILDESDKLALGITDIKDCCCYAIVCVPENSDQISANLLAPIIINKKENIGRQVILKDQDYSVQHLILEEMLKKIEDKNVSSFAQTK